MAKAGSLFRFGPFEVRTNSRELRRDGIRLKLGGQPFLVLQVLLERAGEVVGRDEIRERLWASDTFVDFEHGLNTSVKKVRQVLCDSPVEPRYIETLPRVGYRFIARVECVSSGNGSGVPALESAQAEIAEPRLLSPDTQNLPTATERQVEIFSSATQKLTPWPFSLAFAILAVATVLASAGSIRSLRSSFHLFGSTGSAAAKTYSSLAVLPLQSVSADPTQDYFADGITDELITSFAQYGDLRVISRSSAMRYKGSNQPTQQICRELGVDALVEGTVEHVGTHVRVRVQLIDGASDHNLWARVYDRDLRDVLALESSVAHDTVEEALGRMLPQNQASSAQHRSVNPDAYEAYLQGRFFWKRRSSDAMRKSIELFQKAIALDPKLAVAYAGLADAYSILGSDVLPAPIAQSKAREAANKAIALDPSLAEGHAAMGLIAFYYDWDWKNAEREFRLAVQLNPNYASAHQWYSHYLSAMGRSDGALEEVKRAQQLDPLSLSVNTSLAGEYITRGEYDLALAIDQKVQEMDPAFAPAHLSMGLAYEGKGMWPQAIAELKKAVDLSQEGAAPLAALARGFELSGRHADARRIALTLRDLAKEKYVPSFEVAKAFVAIDDHDTAFRYLEKSYRERESQLPFLNVTTPLEPLYSDPRFRDLCRRMSLPSV